MWQYRMLIWHSLIRSIVPSISVLMSVTDTSCQCKKKTKASETLWNMVTSVVGARTLTVIEGNWCGPEWMTLSVSESLSTVTETGTMKHDSRSITYSYIPLMTKSIKAPSKYSGRRVYFISIQLSQTPLGTSLATSHGSTLYVENNKYIHRRPTRNDC